MFVLFPMRTYAFIDRSAKLCELINTDDGDRPQLVHPQDLIRRPSGMVRFATRLGLAEGDKSVLEAVEKAYRFITHCYRPGAQVILWVSTSSDRKWETDLYAQAAEILAQHLRSCSMTVPAQQISFTLILGTGGTVLVAESQSIWPPSCDEIQSMGTWSDWLKSRLPPGIQHIVCYSYDGNFCSCSISYDLDGGVVSRELRFSSNDCEFELQRDATKHVLYYRQDMLPEWDEHQPVWTCVLNPSSHQPQDALASESTKPAGMYHYEVQRYQNLPGVDGDGSMLVWKSCRKAPN
ncbi:unnamed protein product [Rhizoctonia solani]|uniref:Uncharacterized protein n=1 Tax=Rhizoctonia solani TaxID=456999 RepID=A0A8H3ECK1_9AGAM|nr:unnamed protein product [Rhizoctonia solani]